jgi:hypothetical protein
MKMKQRPSAPEDHIGCLGDFSIDDVVCKKFCAFNIRCAIECNYHIQSEIFEDMISQEAVGATTQ